jgi:hypothetical protein
MPYPTYLSQEQLAETLFGVRDYVDNPKKPHVIDRVQMPFMGVLSKAKKVVPFIRNQVAVKYKSEADELEMQIWYNKDRLRFLEIREGFDLIHNGVQVHMGVEVWHQELKDAGYVVKPNQSRSANFAKRMSVAEGLALFDTLKEKMESAMDRWDILLEQKFLHNVSGNANEPVALTDIVTKTPLVGTYGGRSRANEDMRNGAFLTSTAATFERDMTRLFRNAMLYNRGFEGLGINVILAAGGWIDRYNDSVRGSGAAYGNNMNQQLKGNGPVDIGIPDTDWSFLKTPIVHVPLMDKMAQLTGDATWNRRAYGLNTKTLRFGHGQGEDKELTIPLDSIDQRVTRMSFDGRYMLYTKNPRAHFVHEFNS